MVVVLSLLAFPMQGQRAAPAAAFFPGPRQRWSGIRVDPVADSAGTPHREPIVAGFLGVVPGLGHAYAGEPKRGLVVAAVWFGAGLMAFNSSNKVVTGTGGVLLLGSQVFSVADAALAAERFNKRHERSRK